MAAFLGRALFAAVAIVSVTQNILMWRSSSKAPEPAIPLSTAGRQPASKPGGQTSQSVSFWKHDLSRLITANDTSPEWREQGVFRALVHRIQLRILETKGIFDLEGSQFPERAVAVGQQIYRALLGATAAGETLPSIEFSVSVDDRPNTPENPEDTRTLWVFSRDYHMRAHDRTFLMPDFNYWSWRGVAGSFTEMRTRSEELDEPIPDKIPKAVWRGALWTNPEVYAVRS